MNLRLAFGAGFVSGVMTLSAAQAVQMMIPDGGVAGPGETVFSVSIGNISFNPVAFRLRPKNGVWTDYRLASNQRSIYRCSGCGGTFEIQITTADTMVQYDLGAGQVYQIQINPSRNIYDVYRPE